MAAEGDNILLSSEWSVNRYFIKPMKTSFAGNADFLDGNQIELSDFNPRLKTGETK